MLVTPLRHFCFFMRFDSCFSVSELVVLLDGRLRFFPSPICGYFVSDRVRRRLIVFDIPDYG